MSLPTPYIKLFDVGTREKPVWEAEVWIDVPGEPDPVSVYTTPPAAREATAQRRAEAWINSEDGDIGIALELALLGVDDD